MFKKVWTVSDDKIAIGKKEYSISDIVCIKEKFIPKDRLADNGKLYLKFNDGQEYNVFFPFEQVKQARKAIDYLTKNSSDESAKYFLELAEEESQVKEYRLRCKVCGKVTCYTSKDLETNRKLLLDSAIDSGFAGLEALFGTQYAMYEDEKKADRKKSQIKDYSRCPNCNSTDIEIFTDKEWEEISKNEKLKETNPTVSNIEKIKEYKELLDIGIITQEEFEAKKKQLLDL